MGLKIKNLNQFKHNMKQRQVKLSTAIPAIITEAGLMLKNEISSRAQVPTRTNPQDNNESSPVVQPLQKSSSFPVDSRVNATAEKGTAVVSLYRHWVFVRTQINKLMARGLGKSVLNREGLWIERPKGSPKKFVSFAQTWRGKFKFFEWAKNAPDRWGKGQVGQVTKHVLGPLQLEVMRDMELKPSITAIYPKIERFIKARWKEATR